MVPLNERDSVIPAGVFQIVLTNTSSKEVTASVLSTLANGLEGDRSNRVVTDASGTYILLENDREDVSLGNGSLALWSPSGDAGYTAGGQTVRALFDQMEADGELDGKQTAPSGKGTAPSGRSSHPLSPPRKITPPKSINHLFFQICFIKPHLI